MSHHHGTVRKPDRLTARVLDSATRGSGARLDAYRDGDTFYIDIDLPGVDPADIDVTADHRVLTVRCRRRPADGTPLGTASRQVPLPAELDTDRLEARDEDGVLTLRIPAGEAGGRIEIRLDSPDAAPVATLTTSHTGGWQNWRTESTGTAPVTGVHTVFVTFGHDGPDDFLNLNWLTFRR